MVQNIFAVLLLIITADGFNLKSSEDLLCDAEGSFKACFETEKNLKLSQGMYRTGPALIRDNGFPLENHRVTADDGYRTTIHRIPHGRTQNGSEKVQKKVVLFHHGFIEDGIGWVLNSVEKALPYRLADLGTVDVWITHNRGTFYSLEHTNMSWANYRYWNYSFHEIGTHDVPRIIDYILDTTGERDLYYIGHSMGGSAFAVAMSAFPEYHSKIRTFIGLAPAVLIGKTSAPFVSLIPAFLRQQGLHDKYMSGPFVGPIMMPLMSVVGPICSNRIIASWICYAALETVFGYDLSAANYDMTEEIMTNGLSSASMKGLFHLLQLVTSGKFQRYNYINRNSHAYGQDDPPHYDLDKITAPVVVYCGEDDYLVACSDVEEFSTRLPNLREFRHIKEERFNHIDFLFSKNINFLLNDRIVEIISKDLYYERKG